jgi:hypothetical protein
MQCLATHLYSESKSGGLHANFRKCLVAAKKLPESARISAMTFLERFFEFAVQLHDIKGL